VKTKVGYIIPTLARNLDWLNQSLSSIRNFDLDSEIVLVARETSPELIALSRQFNASLLQERSLLCCRVI
jgi:hypothetical protein